MLLLRVTISILTIGTVIAIFTLSLLGYGINLMLILLAVLFSELIGLFLDLKQGIISITLVLGALAMLKFL